MEIFLKKPLIATVCLLMCIAGMAKAQVLTPEIVTSAGDYYQNAYLKLSVTIGEPVMETERSEQLTLTQGFQQGEYSLTMVEEVGEFQGSIRVFPNPVSEYLQIEIQLTQPEKLRLVLADMHGKILREESIHEAEYILNMQEYAASSMFLQISGASGFSKTFKIMKVK